EKAPPVKQEQPAAVPDATPPPVSTPPPAPTPQPTPNPTESKPEAVKYFEVKFVDWDDKEIEVQKIEKNKPVVKPKTDPVREGYKFIKWDKEDAILNHITSNLIVKAVYEKLPEEPVVDENGNPTENPPGTNTENDPNKDNQNNPTENPNNDVNQNPSDKPNENNQNQDGITNEENTENENNQNQENLLPDLIVEGSEESNMENLLAPEMLMGAEAFGANDESYTIDIGQSVTVPNEPLEKYAYWSSSNDGIVELSKT
ncbi:MAG: hypothetical protein RSC20_03315, partial [Clostridiales bacterium]